MSNKCIFLDRDGVINVDYVDYVYDLEKFAFIDGVQEALALLKKEGYLLILITNQSGIVKGIYKEEDVWLVYNHIQEQTGHALDAMYYAPYHEKWTKSLTRKPDSLMLEKAIVKYDVDITQSWMVGDKERDLIPAVKLGLHTAIVENDTDIAEVKTTNLLAFAQKLVEAKEV